MILYYKYKVQYDEGKLKKIIICLASLYSYVIIIDNLWDDSDLIFSNIPRKGRLC